MKNLSVAWARAASWARSRSWEARVAEVEADAARAAPARTTTKTDPVHAITR